MSVWYWLVEFRSDHHADVPGAAQIKSGEATKTEDGHIVVSQYMTPDVDGLFISEANKKLYWGMKGTEPSMGAFHPNYGLARWLLNIGANHTYDGHEFTVTQFASDFGVPLQVVQDWADKKVEMSPVEANMLVLIINKYVRRELLLTEASFDWDGDNYRWWAPVMDFASGKEDFLNAFQNLYGVPFTFDLDELRKRRVTEVKPCIDVGDIRRRLSGRPGDIKNLNQLFAKYGLPSIVAGTAQGTRDESRVFRKLMHYGERQPDMTLGEFINAHVK